MRPVRHDGTQSRSALGTTRLWSLVTAAFVLLALLMAGCDTAKSEDKIREYAPQSNAMAPTYPKGQGRASIDTAAYDEGPPRLGDVVLFRAPQRQEATRCAVPVRRDQSCERSNPPGSDRMLLRVIARAGQSVGFHAGVAVIDGSRERRKKLLVDAPCRRCTLPVEVTVPKGQVFLAGDNRRKAIDSRSFGPVPNKSILGKAIGLTAD